MGVKALAPAFENQVQLAAAIGKSKQLISKCIKVADLIEQARVSTSRLSSVPLTVLLEISYSEDPAGSMKKAEEGELTSVQQTRRKSPGGTAGGRFVGKALYYRERPDEKSFSIRVNWDEERTPEATKKEVIQRLEAVLKRLKVN